MAFTENHLKAQTRQEGYIEIIMYVPDTNITIANISSTDKLTYNGIVIPDISTLINIKNYTNTTIATLEENLWLLNGRFANYQGNQIPGYISNSISDENGDFETNPKMEIELSRTSNVEYFSLILNPAVSSGYPRQILVKCYDSGDNLIKTVTKDIEWQEPTGELDEDGQPIMVTKILDGLPSVNFDINSDNVYRLELEFVGTRFRHRRIRVSSVMFGRTIYLNDTDVLNVDYLDKASFVPDTLPTRTFRFDVNNYEGIYDIDNPNSSYVKLDKQTRVQFRNGYNVAGYQYDQNDNLVFEDGFPVINNESGAQEIEWDDWKELRLMDISANEDKTATFSCGSLLDIMEETYTQELYGGAPRSAETIVNNVLNFEGLGNDVVEWSSDGIKVPKYDNGILLPEEQWDDTSYKDYYINTPVPDVQCKQVFQLLAFALGATLLIKDDGKIKFANLNINNPSSFTHQFNWTYTDFESIPAAEQLESVTNIGQLSIPKYKSYLEASGDIDIQVDGTWYYNCSVITTLNLQSAVNEVTYSDCLPVAYQMSEDDTSGATPVQGALYTRRGIIRLGGMQTGDTAKVEIVGYPVVTERIQERETTSDSLVLDTQIIMEDKPSYNSDGSVNSSHKEMIKEKYLEWYKKKFKYTIATRGEPLVDAGDYATIQTQFSQQMPVYILQNHWTFDGAWGGDMEVISLG